MKLRWLHKYEFQPPVLQYYDGQNWNDVEHYGMDSAHNAADNSQNVEWSL